MAWWCPDLSDRPYEVNPYRYMEQVSEVDASVMLETLSRLLLVLLDVKKQQVEYLILA
jgi:hypothetical protein